ncbi:MAG: ROK family protein [Arachnia propionica]|uniref:ROK family protein n=1 Tax=Arachnia propionica TaxID=1750 RepID=UPI0027107DAF|nr:ROK family protein [Arachnia propionica]
MGTDAGPQDRAQRARRLLHALRARGSATLGELAKDAGISRPTASLIVADLETVGLIAQSAISTGAGRPAALYSFADGHGFVVALDIQRDELSIAAASIAGEVLHTEIVELVEHGREERLGELCRHIDDLVASLSPQHGPAIRGFASTTGIVDGDGTILRSYSVPQWHSLPLTQQLTALTGLPFRADNDINSAAYGEFATRVTDGRIRLTDTLLHIRLFAGFRTGLILNGDIHRGHRWHAGEINDSLDGELRARLDAETEPTNWALRAAAAIGTVASAIDPTVTVISTSDLTDAGSATEVWGYLKAMRLTTAPKLDMEHGELGSAASTIGALSLALRDAESHFLNSRTRHPVVITGLDRISAVHLAHADRRRSEAHRHAVVVSEPLRIGVVGLGVQARLARHVESEQNRAVIVGACDPDPAAATRVHQVLGRTLPVYTSVRELIESGIGAALVTCLGDLHETVTLELLEAGIPVHLSAPLATSIDGCTRILDAARLNGTRLYAGQPRRHESVVRHLRDLIGDKVVGEVRSIECHRFIPPGDPHPLDPLLGQSGHDIDVLHWLADSETTEVIGLASPQHPRETTMVTMRLRSGVLASYQQHLLTSEHRCVHTVTGSTGRLDHLGDMIRLWRHDEAPGPVSEFPIHDVGDAESLGIAEFLRFVRTGSPTDASPLGAWYAAAVGIQAAESIRTGATPQRIPPVATELREHFLR